MVVFVERVNLLYSNICWAPILWKVLMKCWGKNTVLVNVLFLKQLAIWQTILSYNRRQVLGKRIDDILWGHHCCMPGREDFLLWKRHLCRPSRLGSILAGGKDNVSYGNTMYRGLEAQPFRKCLGNGKQSPLDIFLFIVCVVFHYNISSVQAGIFFVSGSWLCP